MYNTDSKLLSSWYRKSNWRLMVLETLPDLDSSIFQHFFPCHNISTVILVIPSKIFNFPHIAINFHQFHSIYMKSLIFIQFTRNLANILGMKKKILLLGVKILLLNSSLFWRENILIELFSRIIPIIQIMCNNFQ